MGARGAVVLALCGFIALLAFGSWLLNVPMDVILIACAFAIGVILWLASRTRPPEPR